MSIIMRTSQIWVETEVGKSAKPCGKEKCPVEPVFKGHKTHTSAELAIPFLKIHHENMKQINF